MKKEMFINVTGFSFSWHRLLCHSLVRPVFIASGEGTCIVNFKTPLWGLGV
jgi:hypothetical protein